MGSNHKKQKLPPIKRLTGLYLFCMFSIFPVFCTDGFFNIRHDRYYFFLVCSLCALVMGGLLRLFGGGETKNLPHNLKAVHAAKTGPWYRRLSLGDWAMLVLVASAAVSTVLSKYPMESVFGTAGRNNGLILLAVYGGVYFLISRCYLRQDYIFVGLAVCTAFVSLITLLNFFQLDPLWMQEKLSQRDRDIFISTIGNRNLLSSYLCITLPVAVTLFVHTKDLKQQLLYALTGVLGFGALMCADSDSGFLGMGAFIAIYLLFYLRDVEQLKKFFLMLTVMLLGGKLLSFLCLRLPHKGLGALQAAVVHGTVTTVLLVLLVVLTGVLYLLHRAKPKLQLPTGIGKVLGLALGVGVLTVLVGMVYFTCIDPERAPLDLLRLDDSWGSHRGYMWRNSMDLFQTYTWKEKLLGSGPDTFYYVFEPYFEGLAKYGDNSTNAAHNEYLNYLITQGAVGLGAYLALIIGCVIHAWRQAKKEPYYMVFLSAVLCYGIQSLVNIAQPITTPLFILFLGLCASNIPKKGRKTPDISYKNPRKRSE